MDTLPGAIGLLAGAVSYMLGVCAPLGPEEMALPTPCPHWDLARLLSHLCESMADLEAALRAADLPVKFSKAYLAKDVLNTTAKGALVAAIVVGWLTHPIWGVLLLIVATLAGGWAIVRKR